MVTVTVATVPGAVSAAVPHTSFVAQPVPHAVALYFPALAGMVIVTVGAMESTVTVRMPEVNVLPALSVVTTRRS